MEQNEEPFNLFEELKQIRIEKGLDLKNIAGESRIQLMYLEAIENGAFENIPDVYDKFFFQTYLNYLELDDSEKYMQAYRDIRKQTFSPTPQTTIRKISIQNDATHSFFNLNVMFWVIPIVVIIGIVAFLIWNSKGSEQISEKTVQELPVRQIVKEIKSKEKNTRPVVKQNTDGNLSAVTVDVKALEKTWFRLIKDNKDTSEYLLMPKNKMQFKADSVIYFLIGNAAGLDFIINGKSKGVLGKPGEVISYLKITKAGIIAQKNKKVTKRTKNDTTSVH